MSGTIPLVMITLGLTAQLACAARFTDVFDTDPGLGQRQPFMWNMPALAPDSPTGWDLVKGVLEMRTENGRVGPASLYLPDAGVQLTDESTWSLEVGFRHLGGVAPHPHYEAAAYVGWPSQVGAGQYSLVCLEYDAARQHLLVLNGGEYEAPIPADLTGRFHALRITVQERQLRVYVDGDLRCGPSHVRATPSHNLALLLLGPITSGQDGTVRCQWDYVAFTDEGAWAPGHGGWEPSRETAPYSSLPAAPPDGVDPRAAFSDEPYPGIRLISREPGVVRYERALPQDVHRWRQVMAGRPATMQVPFYTYDGAVEPVIQNVYRDCFPLRYDKSRLVGVINLTRGIDDTVFGFLDYKLWYAVSTDGGQTYSEERPVVQAGAGFSPAHPVEYVWIGKNSFVYATLPPFLLRMSNGEVFLPCYYAPLDESGRYYNPRRTSCYSLVFGLIGTWNATGDDLTWSVTAPIRVTPEQSTGGLSECAVIELKNRPGHLLMAIRGSNEGDCSGRVPCCKWKTLSTDYGRTWSEPSPLTFSDGTPFYSPSAQSNFWRSSRTGKVYWIGNISRVRPRGGWPRYPLVVAELDEEKLGIRRETVTVIDDRGLQDGSDMQLSNFGFVEDPATGHLLVCLNRYHGGPGADGPMTYEVEVR